jgi:hypothetical protein
MLHLRHRVIACFAAALASVLAPAMPVVIQKKRARARGHRPIPKLKLD